MGASDAQAAQRLANEANLAMTQSTNEWNYAIAHEANLWNWNNLQTQNQWNIDQWNRENEYNSPNNQVQRYLEAGINPLWAIGNGNPGNAQHLESGTPAPAEVPTMEAGHVDPEYDPYLAQHIGNIVTSARDVANNFNELQSLGLQAEDVRTRRAAQISRSSLDRASAAEYRASTQGREIQNAWNTSTFDVRVREEFAKLHNLEAQYRSLEAGSEESRAKKLEIDEHRNFLQKQMFAIDEQLKLQKRDLDIRAAAVSVQDRAVGVEEGRLSLENEKFDAQIKQWNNQNLLQFMYRFGQTIEGKLSAKVGGDFMGVSGSGSSRETLPADMSKMISCGIELVSRAAEDPTNEQKAQDAVKANEIIQKFVDQRKPLWQKYEEEMNFNSSSSVIWNNDSWKP